MYQRIKHCPANFACFLSFADNIRSEIIVTLAATKPFNIHGIKHFSAPLALYCIFAAPGVNIITSFLSNTITSAGTIFSASPVIMFEILSANHAFTDVRQFRPPLANLRLPAIDHSQEKRDDREYTV